MEGRTRRGLCLGVVLVLTNVGSGIAIDAARSEPAAIAASAKVAGWPAGRPASYTLRYNDPKGSAAEAPRRRIVALNAWEWPAISRIKSANPGVLVLVYKDPSSTRDSVRCGLS